MKTLAYFFIFALFLNTARQTLQAQPLEWVSGVGDDANPGSRTAPGKTFGGMISKTGAGGQINALDGGTFGSVTIVKAITLDGGNVPANIVATGSYMITAAANPSDVVTIRNLTMNGANTNFEGIHLTTCCQLRVENCSISGCTGNAIDIQPGFAGSSFGPVNVILKNCRIFNCGGNGIYINPYTAQPVTVTLENCQIEQCTNGVYIENAGVTNTVFIHNSVLSQNLVAGLNVAGAQDSAVVQNSVVNYNGVGIVSSGTATISGNTIMGNAGYGLTNAPGGNIVTYHDNRISGNSPDGAPTRSAPLR